MLDALDRQITHALQCDPRVPFRRVAEVIGVSEQTVARRYRGLVRSGAVRVVGVVDPTACGDVEWVTPCYRLRAGVYRARFAVDPEARTMHVLHVHRAR